jgi:hypothetical protein
MTVLVLLASETLPLLAPAKKHKKLTSSEEDERFGCRQYSVLFWLGLATVLR